MRFETVYYGGGRGFCVAECDAVVIRVEGRLKVVGYSHSRAWRAAFEAAI